MIPTTTKELAKAIGQKEERLVSKMLAMNGQVNYSTEQAQLTPAQVKVVLEKYLSGTRPLQGENRKTAIGILTSLGTSQELVTEPVPELVQEPVKQKRQRTARPVQEPVIEPVQSKPAEPVQFQLTWRNSPYLAGAVLVVFAQAMHYAFLEQQESPLQDWQQKVSAWFIALVFEYLILLMSIKASSPVKKWCWLVGFGLVAFAMNLSFMGW